MNLTNDLLTENKYWTFWSNGWQKRINVSWNGKTKFAQIKSDMEQLLGAGFMYERQVQIQKPEFTYL